MSSSRSDQSSTPQCVGIILDGNRRWAKARGLPSLAGHAEGARTLETITYATRSLNIKHLVVYAFSTENWHRTPDEVTHLMELLETVLGEHLMRIAAQGIRVRFAGERERFSVPLQSAMQKLENESMQNADFTLWVCLSYGGRAEIIRAANELQCSNQKITEISLQEQLWTAGMPDPDIIIRTGGEQRLSNFLLWQAAYSELFFIDEYWPDFTQKHLEDILAAFNKRTRRMGI